MKKFFHTLRQDWQPPKAFRTSAPGFRIVICLASLLFVLTQALGNMPRSELRDSTRILRQTLDTLGLYHRGWGMFAATNTQTSVARLELRYAKGDVLYQQYIHLRPGYRISAWNEVQQDLQYPKGNDQNQTYLEGFLRYNCLKYDIRSNDPLLQITYQMQSYPIPASKAEMEKSVPFINKRTAQCSDKK
jgi:hypothetical protein